MEQIRDIEEILTEFREKYSEKNETEPPEASKPPNSETTEITETNQDIPEKETSPSISFKPRTRRSRNQYGFFRIIAVQAVTAALIAAALIAVKLLSPEMFSGISERLRDMLL